VVCPGRSRTVATGPGSRFGRSERPAWSSAASRAKRRMFSPQPCWAQAGQLIVVGLGRPQAGDVAGLRKCRCSDRQGRRQPVSLRSRHRPAPRRTADPKAAARRSRGGRGITLCDAALQKRSRPAAVPGLDQLLGAAECPGGLVAWGHLQRAWELARQLVAAPPCVNAQGLADTAAEIAAPMAGAEGAGARRL